MTHPELIELFAVAESLLSATGEAVALCPTYGDPAQAEAGEGAR